MAHWSHTQSSATEIKCRFDGGGHAVRSRPKLADLLPASDFPKFHVNCLVFVCTAGTLL